MGYIDLKMICVAENSNKFQKTLFWKEKSVEDVVTIGPMAQATLYLLKKVDCLFAMLRSSKLHCPHHAFSNIRKPLMRRSASKWFCNV